jgi:hypothetical protein
MSGDHLLQLTTYYSFSSTKQKTPHKMSYGKSEIKRFSDRYGQSDEDGREQLFEKIFALHHHTPQPVPDDLANTLKAVIISTHMLPKEVNSDTLQVYIMQELFWGFHHFCMSNPSKIDYAWNAMVFFIAKLDELNVAEDKFDAHAFAVTELKYWIAENCSDDHCDMSGTTSNAVLDSDSSILAITRAEMEENEAQQLANLARNRKDRKQCIVNKVIAARALRDGYVPSPSGPDGTLFQGSLELRSIEFALQRNEEQGTEDGYQTSCDVIAATYQLRACAKSLLDILPRDGCVFPERYLIPDLKPGDDSKLERLASWKAALQAVVVGERPNSNFALRAYAGLALENLRSPRDETSAELFSFDNTVF